DRAHPVDLGASLSVSSGSGSPDSDQVWLCETALMIKVSTVTIHHAITSHTSDKLFSSHIHSYNFLRWEKAGMLHRVCVGGCVGVWGGGERGGGGGGRGGGGDGGRERGAEDFG